METVESCCSLRIVPADLFRPFTLIEIRQEIREGKNAIARRNIQPAVKTTVTKTSCPISTPRLKNNSAIGMAWFGNPLRQALRQSQSHGGGRIRIRATASGPYSVHPAPRVHDLDRHQHDAERDSSLRAWMARPTLT